MAVLARPVTMPRTLLLHLWAIEDLGGPHPALGVDDAYTPQDTAAPFTGDSLTMLAELGLARDGALTREFRRVLRLLASPARELYCWSTHADASLDRRFLVSAGDDQAVGMQVRGDTVSITPVDERRFVDEFVFELPEFPPARVRELVVPRRDFTDRNKPRDLFASAPSPAQQLAEQMRQPREAMHQIYAAGTFDGRLRRSLPFSMLDLYGVGRILVFVDGEDNLHRLPGTPGNLAASLLKTWQAM